MEIIECIVSSERIVKYLTTQEKEEINNEYKKDNEYEIDIQNALFYWKQTNEEN